MIYDEDTSDRFRELIDGLPGTSEKRMMGGVCFFLNGNMIGGADLAPTGRSRLMFRVGKPNVEAAEKLPHGELLVQGGRRMTGFYFVDVETADADTLKQWMSLAVANAMSLPEK